MAEPQHDPVKCQKQNKKTRPIGLSLRDYEGTTIKLKRCTKMGNASSQDGADKDMMRRNATIEPLHHPPSRGKCIY